MFKKILFTMLPVSILLLVVFGVAEYKLRQRHTSWDPNGADSGPRAHRECYRLDINTGYEPIPNKCDRDDKGFYRTWEGAAQDTAYKMLMFGDSIADQHRWVKQTAEQLQGKWNHPVEIKNAGTPGFDTCSELQMFRDKGLNEDFDHLLLQFCPNDLASTATIVALPNNRVRFFIGFEYVEFPRWLLQSKVLTWLSINTFNRKRQSDGNRSAIAPIQHCLQEFRDLAADKNKEFTVVLFPSFIDDLNSPETILTIEGLNLTTKTAEERSRELLENLNITYVEVRRFFETNNLSLEKHRNAPNDLWHPDNTGQDMIGNELGTWLSTEYTQPATK